MRGTYMSLFSAGKKKLESAVADAKAKVAALSQSFEKFKKDVVDDLNRLKFDVDARLKALEAKAKSADAADAVKAAGEAASAVETAVKDGEGAADAK
jgi:TPP-dependent trihydroxycyclohexane-1,2-dione (THcHDO) dehydratase